MDPSTLKVTATSFAIAYMLGTNGSFGYRLGSLIMITALAAVIALAVSNFID